MGTRMYNDLAEFGDYHGSMIYSGVRGDIEAIEGASNNPKAGPLWAIFLFDFPFSFVADTLLLPITIYEELSKNSEHKKKAMPDL